jgi:hypothetical protein
MAIQVNDFGILSQFIDFNDLWELQVPEIPNCSETAAPYTSPQTFNSVATSPLLSSTDHVDQQQGGLGEI